jgi:hypothetical protein
VKRNQQPSCRPDEHVLLTLLLVDVGKEQRQQEGSCQQNGRSHIDMIQQVAAPTYTAASVENSRELRDVYLRIQASFLAFNSRQIRYKTGP